MTFKPQQFQDLILDPESLDSFLLMGRHSAHIVNRNPLLHSQYTVSFLSLPHPAYYCPRIQTQNIILGLSIVHLHRHSFYFLSLFSPCLNFLSQVTIICIHCNLSFCLCAVISHLVTTKNIGTYKNVTFLHNLSTQSASYYKCLWSIPSHHDHGSLRGLEIKGPNVFRFIENVSCASSHESRFERSV